MASKENCWEYKRCGREPGGPKAGDLGVCPASADPRGQGIHGGKNSGRSCWAVAGTFCNGEVQGTFVSKQGGCLRCDFYQDVARAEGTALQSHNQLHSLFS